MIILLSGCLGTRRELQRHLHETQQQYPQIPADALHVNEPNGTPPSPDKELDMQQTVLLALRHYPGLQAELENLGVAQAEWYDAARYSNPQADLAVRKAHGRSGHNVEFETQFPISDLWQVPLRTDTALHMYQAMQHEILNTARGIIRDAKKAYIDLLHAQHDIRVVTDIYEDIQDLRDQIHKRFTFGYTDQLDLSLADVRLGEWKQAYQDTLLREHKARANLAYLLGITPEEMQHVTLTQPFIIETVSAAPDETTLRELAYLSRPDIHELERRIQQYQSQKRYEQTRVFPHVGFGASFEQELSGQHLRGPALSVEVPLFDTNQASIQRAEYLRRRTQKELQDIYNSIARDTTQARQRYVTAYNIFTIYQEQTLPELEHALTFSRHYAHQKRMNMPTLLSTRSQLHRTRRAYYSTLRDMWHALIDLSYTCGIDIQDYITLNGENE